MQLRDILVMALVAGALPAAAACGARSTTLDGYGDSSDEDDDGGTTTSSTGSTSTWSTTSSTWTSTWTTSTTTPTTTGVTCDQTSFDCNSCQECAINGPCADEVNECASSEECVGLVGCVNDCDATCSSDPDPAQCFELCANGPGGCTEVYAGGIGDYNALVECVIVEQCPTLCGG